MRLFIVSCLLLFMRSGRITYSDWLDRGACGKACNSNSQSFTCNGEEWCDDDCCVKHSDKLQWCDKHDQCRGGMYCAAAGLAKYDYCRSGMCCEELDPFDGTCPAKNGDCSCQNDDDCGWGYCSIGGYEPWESDELQCYAQPDWEWNCCVYLNSAGGEGSPCPSVESCRKYMVDQNKQGGDLNMRNPIDGQIVMVQDRSRYSASTFVNGLPVDNLWTWTPCDCMDNIECCEHEPAPLQSNSFAALGIEPYSVATYSFAIIGIFSVLTFVFKWLCKKQSTHFTQIPEPKDDCQTTIDEEL